MSGRKNKYRPTVDREETPVIFIYADGDSEKNYFEGLRVLLRDNRSQFRVRLNSKTIGETGLNKGEYLPKDIVTVLKAKANAEKLLDEGMGNPDCVETNPSTLVYKLIEEIIECTEGHPGSEDPQ